MKANEHCASSMVQEADLNHMGLVGAACDNLQPWKISLNSSSIAANSSRYIRTANTLAPSSSARLISPVVVLSHDRTGYLAKTMTTLLKHWSSDPDNEVQFPVFISVDSTHQPTLLLARSLKYAAPIQLIANIRDPSRCNGLTDGYCWLSHHYKMLLQLFFVCLKTPRLIFLEEDLEIAPDFFSYFAATAPLMDQDSSILCVSAWNDHGQQGRVRNNSQLYRTDIMPGLGWMLSASVGLEALPGWPGAGWDEFLRDQRFIKGRQCVFPEVARTHTFGAKGASGGIGFKEHLEMMVLNQQPVDWAQQDLSYLLRDNYAATMRKWLSSAVWLQGNELGTLDQYCSPSQPPDPDTRDLILAYKNNQEYSDITGRKLGPMMWDISYGGKVPRASYDGTVVVRCRGRRLFLVLKSKEAWRLP